MNIIDALQVTTQKIKKWTQEKLDNVAMGLEIIGDKLYLKNNNGIIEDSMVPLLTRITTINLLAVNWEGETTPYSQVVEISSVTPTTKIDLQPTVEQIVYLQDQGIALMVENDDCVTTVYSFGEKPLDDMSIQAQLMEVSFI